MFVVVIVRNYGEILVSLITMYNTSGVGPNIGMTSNWTIKIYYYHGAPTNYLWYKYRVRDKRTNIIVIFLSFSCKILLHRLYYLCAFIPVEIYRYGSSDLSLLVTLYTQGRFPVTEIFILIFTTSSWTIINESRVISESSPLKTRWTNKDCCFSNVK